MSINCQALGVTANQQKAIVLVANKLMTGLSIDKETAAGIISYLMGESGLDPNAWAAGVGDNIWYSSLSRAPYNKLVSYDVNTWPSTGPQYKDKKGNIKTVTGFGIAAWVFYKAEATKYFKTRGNFNLDTQVDFFISELLPGGKRNEVMQQIKKYVTSSGVDKVKEVGMAFLFSYGRPYTSDQYKGGEAVDVSIKSFQKRCGYGITAYNLIK